MNTDTVRAALKSIQQETDRNGLRYTTINSPSGRMTKAALLAQGQDNVAFCADIQSSLGVIYDYADQGLQALQDTPAPAPTLFLPVKDGGIFGRTKWLAGSYGCDIFLPRGTGVLAPMDCTIREVIGGTGLQGGAEIILATPDNRWAWRYRHIQAQPGIKVGVAVSAGQMIATINDPSLDQLGAIPSWAVQQAGQQFPDGWQHLDLSVNSGSDQFAPTGGGGGNVNAYGWLVEAGYQGRTLNRTPGPPDAGIGHADAIRMSMPAVYRED